MPESARILAKLIEEILFFECQKVSYGEFLVKKITETAIDVAHRGPRKRLPEYIKNIEIIPALIHIKRTSRNSDNVISIFTDKISELIIISVLKNYLPGYKHIFKLEIIEKYYKYAHSDFHGYSSYDFKEVGEMGSDEGMTEVESNALKAINRIRNQYPSGTVDAPQINKMYGGQDPRRYFLYRGHRFIINLETQFGADDARVDTVRRPNTAAIRENGVLVFSRASKFYDDSKSLCDRLRIKQKIINATDYWVRDYIID